MSGAGPCAAVVVTFDPEPARLAAVLAALRGQAEVVILVDNGSRDSAVPRAAAAGAGARLVENGANLGLAAAQNLGIEAARAGGAAFVLLLDQDTVLPPGSVAVLRAEHAALASRGLRVAAVGPAYREANSGALSAAWRARGLRIARTDPGEGGSVAADWIIASGSLIALAALDAVGEMEAGLFIDLVDMEWGLRAARAGYASFQAGAVVADHVLGAGRMRLGPWSAPRHAPARNYFWVRNALVLARRRGVPLAWRLHLLTRVAAFTVLFPLGSGASLTRLRMVLAGLRDGIGGRLGPLPAGLARPRP